MDVLFFALLMAATFGTGGLLQRRHDRDLERREEKARGQLVSTCEAPPGRIDPTDAALVTGSVVVSLDYFRRFVAAIQAIFGGHIGGYERALARARREAMLRMQEAAAAAGYRQVVCVRLETARLASSRRNGEGTAGIEVVALGTGLRTR